MRQLAMHALIYLLAIASAAFVACQAYAAGSELQVRIAYLAWQPDSGPVLSNVIPEPLDAGLRGAELAIEDSNSTGRFLKQRYHLDTVQAENPEHLLERAAALHAEGVRLFVVNAPAAQLTALAKSMPDSLLLIVGQTPDDQRYADALRRSAKRFGLRIVAEKPWSFDNDQRRSAQADMPLFTQTTEYDVVLVADERGDFGEYVPYQTWYPRPVAGTQGLTPTGWHKSVETYGAAQLQKRFEEHAGRWMNDRDFAAWIAVRSIATAVTRSREAASPAIRSLLLDEQLPIDGFKGRKLSYRSWDGQLRQPIPVVQPRALVTTSPQDGFLHPDSELDTLGDDRAESSCDLAGATS